MNVVQIESLPYRTKVRVVHIQPFGIWKWNHKFDTCSICKENIHQSGMLEQPQDLLENSASVCIGKCSHVFHKTCITKWLEVSQNCPLCNQLWELQFEE